MRFLIASSPDAVPGQRDVVVLVRESEPDDDFHTLFTLWYFDPTGESSSIGEVKIARRRPGVDFPHGRFGRLGDEFFSLGQDESYYTGLRDKLGPERLDETLGALNDIALDLDLFAQVRSEEVTRRSLLRTVTAATVRNQFHRLAMGGEPLTDYSFTYRYLSGTELSFTVVRESKPPTNVHVLVGSNGVGKSRLLRAIEDYLLHPENSQRRGVIDFGDTEGEFASLVSVAFSAFDDFERVAGSENDDGGIGYTYVGLRRQDGSGLKTSSDLANEFAESVRICQQGARRGRWRRALKELLGDPIFFDERIDLLADPERAPESPRDWFHERLSSGHKAVLLTITRLVECVAEQTLVLIDEPETHLHPPLLSAFMRALSDLLANRNGVAIVATHSPVVLQEVPRTCVWKLRRSGDVVQASQPLPNTFGENVGTLTREVFGLEVTKSGFHKMLSQAVDETDDADSLYESVISEFGDLLGAEARALLQTLIILRDRGY